MDATGITIGKGFAGVIKRHHFSSQDATHGNSLSHRAPGSIGQNQTPGRVFKGKKMAGHLGNARRTVQNLEVVRVDEARGLLLVKGAVPGAQGRRRAGPAFRQGGERAMKLDVAGGTAVEVADRAFAAPYNETLVHPGGDRLLRGRTGGNQGPEVALGRAWRGPQAVAAEGDRARARGHDPKPHLARRRGDLRGAAARTTAGSSTARCTARRSGPSCRSWCAGSA